MRILKCFLLLLFAALVAVLSISIYRYNSTEVLIHYPLSLSPFQLLSAEGGQLKGPLALFLFAAFFAGALLSVALCFLFALDLPITALLALHSWQMRRRLHTFERRGEEEMATENHERALEFFEKALSIANLHEGLKRDRLILMTAGVLLKIAKEGQALELIETSSQYRSLDTRFLALAARIHLKMKNYSMARKELQKIADSRPKDPQTAKKLLLCAEKVGDLKAAIFYQKVLIGLFENDEKEEMKAKLAELESKE